MTEKIYNKFTTHFKKSIVGAYGMSLAEKKKEIGLSELFFALLLEKGSLGRETLIKTGFKEGAKTSNNLSEEDISLQKILKSDEELPLSQELKKVIVDALNVAAKFGHGYVGTEHLLYSLIDANDEAINKILKSQAVRAEDIINHLEIILNSTAKFSDMAEAVGALKEKIKPGRNGKARRGEAALDFFGNDLSTEEAQKNINPVIGREEEINRVIQILCRRDKNNPMLIGEPGVGKTAIIEGLAKKIMLGEVPDALMNKKIYALDMPLMVAGTSYRGEFEARIKQVVEEVKMDKNIILFIDEIHNIMGAGAATGTMDAANILKPALARGEIRCIGATTFADFKKQIEPDSALTRRMQKVIVREPSPTEANQIIRGIKNAYEKHHFVFITDEAIAEAVRLAVRYLPEQFLPDKAIDLIDEAASKKRLSQPQNPVIKKKAELDKELLGLAASKIKLVGEGKYNEALKLKNKEIELISKLYKLEEEQLKQNIMAGKEKQSEITAADIRALISEATKIKIADGAKISETMLELAERLKKKIVGQDEVIDKLAKTLKRSAAGLTGQERPLGSFVFGGPSGSGKTYTAKVLAELLNPGREGLIRLDMSEYGERFNMSKMIGAPAGYVGYDEGGQLTEKIKRNPYAVILLDEIEKAHPDIFNLFLQILADGQLTDAKGREVNFKNTIIIMTTNVGVKKASARNTLGFGEEDGARARENNFKESLRDFLRPELINRLDGILIFNELTDAELIKIVNMELAAMNQKLMDKNLALLPDARVAPQIIKNIKAENGGARAIHEAMREMIENPLADKILNQESKKTRKQENKKARKQIIKVGVRGNKIVLE